MGSIGRRDLLLLMIGLDPSGRPGGELGGLTRLQKLIFLLDKKEGLEGAASGFDFVPYKAGPYSSRIYDDLEFLENLGYLASEIVAEASDAEAQELDLEESLGDDLDFETLIPNDAHLRQSPDMYEERRFRLTPKGLAKVEKLLLSGVHQPQIEAIRRVKSRFSTLALSDLLYYVYTKYPESAVESEIRSKVLRRG